MKTTAEQIYKISQHLRRDDNNFMVLEDYDWVEKITACAHKVGIECPNSVDSSFRLTFQDGSVLLVDNPRQHSFPCVFRYYPQP